MEIPKGRGVSKAQFFERKYDTKMEFLEGWVGGGGFNLRTFIGRGMDIFWNNTITELWETRGEQGHILGFWRCQYPQL